MMPELRGGEDSAPVWYRFLGDVMDVAAAAFLERLKDMQVRPEPGDQSPGGAAGIVFVSRCTPPVLESVEELSRRGTVSVLVAAVERGVLTDEDVWLLLRAGARDVIALDDRPGVVERVAAQLLRWRKVDSVVESASGQYGLLGSSPAWRACLRDVVSVARFTDAPVLLLGESGTGKELLARLIHELDQRSGKRSFVVLDCSAVQPELAGSEFFGHERGAFTGAVAARDGAFALADRGTLFLDEVGDLPPAMQALLLRAIQEQTYKRVGGNDWRRTRFRLICATHRPIEQMRDDGRFRADLFYRMSGVVCRVPPLRDRPEDIIQLFRTFVRDFSNCEELPGLDPAVERILVALRYPGNVRELRQVARRTAASYLGRGRITPGHLPADVRPPVDRDDWCENPFDAAVRRALARGIGLKEIGRMASELAIQIAVDDAEGNLQVAARQLRVTDRALQMRRASSWRRSGPAAAKEA